jgi:hypothetical protein
MPLPHPRQKKKGFLHAAEEKGLFTRINLGLGNQMFMAQALCLCRIRGRRKRAFYTHQSWIRESNV